jgi:hypothetical protein
LPSWTHSYSKLFCFQAALALHCHPLTSNHPSSPATYVTLSTDAPLGVHKPDCPLLVSSKKTDWVWWCMAVIPALRRQRQKYEFKAREMWQRESASPVLLLPGWHGRWHVWSPGILGLLCAVRTSVFNSFKSLLLLGAQVLKSGKGKVSLGAGARDPQELCFLS